MTLCLTSCLTPTGKQKPVDVVAYGAKSGAGSTGMHTVLGGDTVYTVAKEYNLPLREIISLNNLSPPYHLNSGFRLRLPPPNEYKVGTGDTLNGLSRMFNVSVSEMARLNNLPAPYTLRAGQIVRLPSPQPKLEEEFSTNPAPPSFEQVSVPMAVGSVEREVLAPPPGQAPSKDNKAVSAVLAPPASSSSSAPSTPSTTAAATSAFPPQPAAKTVGVQKVAAVTPSVVSKPPPRVGNGKFMRPVDGKVLSGYGPKPDGLHNDGINIKAPRGSAVRAADNGVVAYVGSDMQGYGNLILIRHADRWMTAYAHMEKMLVKKGDVVKAGQSIGTVGSTGGVDSPQLHFEVRKGTQAMNPETYL
jgi:murein DD-endopeptidase MepM/ murein hydrolase activator NlpD